MVGLAGADGDRFVSVQAPASLAVDDAAITLSDAVLDDLRPPTPDFETTHSVPDALAADGSNLSPPGESATYEATIGYCRGSDTPPGRVQFGVVGPGVSESFTVRVEGDGTPTDTGTSTPNRL
jgi:hypothetical protein